MELNSYKMEMKSIHQELKHHSCFPKNIEPKDMTLDLISELLLKPCMTLDILGLYRSVLLDLVIQWKQPTIQWRPCPCHPLSEYTYLGSPKHHLEGSLKENLDFKCFAFFIAFSKLLPLAPHLSRYLSTRI